MEVGDGVIGVTELRRYGKTEEAAELRKDGTHFVRNYGDMELRMYGITEISKVKFSTTFVREKNRYNFAE